MKRLIDVIKREEPPVQTGADKKYFQKEYIYRGLKSLIETGSGWGFHNADMGHPVYVLGASNASPKMIKDWEYADSPEKSLLYKMLSQLSKELKESGIEELCYIWWYDFSEWRDFCELVVGIYNKKKRRTHEA